MQNRKSIVYLDQNFVSNLAKERYREDWKDSLADYYRQLNDLISDLTDRDIIVCPTSSFHTEESELGQRVRSFLWHFVEQLGYGLSFKTAPEIMQHQIVAAARAYCGIPAMQCTAWKVAFNHDPQVPVGQLTRPALLINIPNEQDFNEYIRLSRTSIANEYRDYKSHCRGKRKAYSDELEAQKKQFVFEIFNPRTALNVKSSNLEVLFNLLGLAGIIEFHNTVKEIFQQGTNPEEFFDSSQLFNCSYIHIWASLMAADIFFHPEKKPTMSLFMDFEIVASVLPYTDILATDSYMSELIRNAKLLDRFSAKIFSSSEIGVKGLIAQLQSF